MSGLLMSATHEKRETHTHKKAPLTQRMNRRGEKNRSNVEQELHRKNPE